MGDVYGDMYANAYFDVAPVIRTVSVAAESRAVTVGSESRTVTV